MQQKQSVEGLLVPPHIRESVMVPVEERKKVFINWHGFGTLLKQVGTEKCPETTRNNIQVVGGMLARLGENEKIFIKVKRDGRATGRLLRDLLQKNGASNVYIL